MQNWSYATKQQMKTTNISRHDAMLHTRKNSHKRAKNINDAVAIVAPTWHARKASHCVSMQQKRSAD